MLKNNTHQGTGFRTWVLVGLMVPFTALTNAVSGAERPNILLIMADDLGYGDLSSYGAEDMRTPHIDGIINAGMRFDRFYANSSVCSPSRASLLSGRTPDRAGVPGVVREHDLSKNWGFLNPGLITLPDALKSAGYHTALVGKWHLGTGSPNLPNDRGFDLFHGFLGDMMDDYYTHLREGHNYLRLNREVIQATGHATDLFNDWAVDYIRGRKGASQPFFLYLAHLAPHDPIQPPQASVDRVLQREPGISPQRAKMVALIEHMDDGIGKVLKALEDEGLAENTLVIFTSDNGGRVDLGGSNGDLKSGKERMFEGGIRVPFGVSWPGRIAPGSHSRRIALTMDLFPSLCEAAVAVCNHEMDGRSILPTWKGLPQPEQDGTRIWVRRRADGTAKEGSVYAARNGDFKLLQTLWPGDPYLLFNLAADPGETTPLSQSHPAYAQLQAALSAHFLRADQVGWHPNSPAIPLRRLTLESPPPGTEVKPGGTYPLSWKAEGAIGPVALSYSTDDYSWVPVPEAQSLPASGTYSLSLPSNLKPGAIRIRASALDGDVSDFRRVSFIPASLLPYDMMKRKSGLVGWRRSVLLGGENEVFPKSGFTPTGVHIPVGMGRGAAGMVFLPPDGKEDLAR